MKVLLVLLGLVIVHRNPLTLTLSLRERGLNDVSSERRCSVKMGVRFDYYFYTVP